MTTAPDKDHEAQEAPPLAVCSNVELKPCPFCGAGDTRIIENGKVWMGMKYSAPISVSVRHYCSPIAGQPSRGIERIGRDLESAVKAWNMRFNALNHEPGTAAPANAAEKNSPAVAGRRGLEG